MVFEFFAYWNGEQIRDLFEAVVALTSGGDYLGLLKSVMLLGFLCVITVCALRYRGIDAMSFVFAALIFYTVTLVPKVDVNIRDDRAGTVYVVQNVPLGIAFMAGTTSHVGHWLTQSFENVFTAVDAERFSRFGMVFPQRAVSALLAAGPVTPQGRLLVGDFNRYCVVPELVDYPEKIDALTQSGNLWQTITQAGWLNPARRTPDLDNNWIGCDEAAVVIENHLNTVEVPAIERHLAMKLIPDSVDASNLILRVLPQSESLLLGISRSLSTSIKHSVFMNTLGEDIANVAALANHPLSMASNLAKSQGNLASEINYRTMAQIAKDALPKVRNALEFVILASFPLVFIMMIALGHMSMMLLRSYLTLLIWIQLWAPISAVMNYLMVTVDAHPMNQIIAEYGANTVFAANLIREFGASSQAIAGFLTIMAPIIAFAIAKGSDMATAQLASSIMAPAQNAAQSQGAGLASGSINLGNASWGNVSTNNVSGNKNDLSTSFTSADMLRTASAYGSVTRAGNGTVTGMSVTPVSMGVTNSVGLGDNASAATSSSLSTGYGYSQSVHALQSMATQTSDRAMAGFTRLLNTEISRQSGLMSKDSSQMSMSETLSASTSQTLSSSLSNSESASIQSSGSVNTTIHPSSESTTLSHNMVNNVNRYLDKPQKASDASAAHTYSTKPDTSSTNSSFGNSMSVKTVKAEPGTYLSSGLKLSTLQNQIDTATGQKSSASNTECQEAYQTLLSATRQIAERTQDSAIRNAAQSFESQLTNAFNLSQSKGFEQSSHRVAQQSTGYVSNQDIRTMMDTSPHALQKATDIFGSPEAAQSALFHSAQARSYFAQQLQDDIREQTPVNSNMQPLSPQTVDAMGRTHQSDFTNEQQGYLHNAMDANRLDTRNAQTRTIGDKSVYETPDTGNIEKSVNAHQLKTHDQSSGLEQSMLQERGATNVAKALYDEKQSGIPTVINNAYLGGFLYSSPTQYQEKLHDEKQNVPALKQSLQTIGEKSRDVELSELELITQKQRDISKTTEPQ